MERYAATRDHLLREQQRLVQRFHQALQLADEDLGDIEIKDSMFAAELWATHVVAILGSELYELHDVIAALERLDAGSYGSCSSCGGNIDALTLCRALTATVCSDCAITRELVAVPARAV